MKTVSAYRVSQGFPDWGHLICGWCHLKLFKLKKKKGKHFNFPLCILATAFQTSQQPNYNNATRLERQWYSAVHKYLDSGTLYFLLALHSSTLDLKWNMNMRLECRLSPLMSGCLHPHEVNRAIITSRFIHRSPILQDHLAQGLLMSLTIYLFLFLCLMTASLTVIGTTLVFMLANTKADSKGH